MGSDRKMCKTLLWLLASLAFFSWICSADGSPLKVMSAPNLLRVGTPENIFVECQDCTDDNDIRVEIRVMNYPTKTKMLVSTSVTLNSNNKFQGLEPIQIPAEDFSKDPDMKQYVYLQAQFPDQLLEKVVLVSFHSGYIFIQTDKTLYTPGSKVHYRLFALTPHMEPVERNNKTYIDPSVEIMIMTPEGIILALDQTIVKSGIHSGHYQLAEIVSIGLWKVVAKFHSKPQLTYSAEFEVKQYVLPSFEVKLTSEASFFYVDSQKLTINIRATYLFGKEVDGTAYGVFGVVHEGQRRSFPSSLQRVPIVNGQGEVTLTREHITQTFHNILDLVGSPIYVTVSVLTETGTEMVEAELRAFQIVTSPYTIQFKRTPKYFKPGMTFDMMLEILNPDGTPVEGVEVGVNADVVQGITASNGMARLAINTEEYAESLTINAKTNDPNISPERQASATMVALPYITKSNNYLHIGVDTAEVELGQNMKMNLNFNKQTNAQDDITYLILSRGQLVKHGRYKTEGQVLIALIVPITKDMLPSFRIVAYYHTSDNEVVSDSVWVDVKDTCMGSLKLETTTNPPYLPRNKFGLKITGDPGATVGLVAVDKGVYVLNKQHTLTQKKVWDTVEKYDTGCTPGGGKDSMSVFYDAGLLFKSNSASGTPNRQELKCPATSRRKRATTITDVTTSLVSQYKEGLQRDCCLDGMRETPLSYTCEVRSEYITDGTACVEAFLHCCKELESQRAEKKRDSLQLARSEEDDHSYMDSNEIVSRTKFPESWLWSDIKLPACPQEKSNCYPTSFQTEFPLQDSITTWQFTGISLSRTHGICVADSLEVIVRKDFFVDLRLPYSAVRGEQLEIKAILHNYSPNPGTVRVELIEVEHVCSAASKHGKYRQEVTVGAEMTRSVPFIIIPIKEGQYRIEVKATLKESLLSDGIIKILRVVPEGLLITFPQIVTLDPAKKGVDGQQVETINSRISMRDSVPNTPTITQISVTGREDESLMFKNTISGESMGNLIYQPSGCGEENMMHMTLPVIATMYLDKTNQWEAVGIERRNEAIQHIITGYQTERNSSRKNDGSFAMDLNHQSSTWLTAYVVKVFAIAQTLMAVERHVICDAVRFLIHNAQQPDGQFGEVGKVAHKEMIGNVRGTDSDASMTAFCLIAMQESRTLCAATLNTLPGSIDKAAAYLERRLLSLINPYAVAMTSYALANENKLNQEFLLMFASPDLSHWPVPKGRVYTLEATAYALLALVKAEAFEETRPIVRWLNKHQRTSGRYGSLQATIIVYQAVAEYWTSKREPDYDLNVDILLPGRSNPYKYNLNVDNLLNTRTSKMNYINKDVQVKATGRGEATLTMVSLYYALPKEKESDCEKFNLSVQLLPEKMDEDGKIYNLRIEVLYKNKEHDATMSVLDIGLPTGFTVNTNDLNLLSKGRARTITKYKIDDQSERGSLIIYLDKVSHKRPEEITFRIHQKLKVGVLQPAAVSVYEYNNQTYCVKFYHPERINGEILRLCLKDECTCAEENCSMQKKGKINNDERTAKTCEITGQSKIEFVYKVRVENLTDGLSTDIYRMRILDVIKEGTSDVGPQGKLRTFLSFQHCRAALDLGISKTYLIMGTSKAIYRDEQNQLHQYVLGERTWIEYWPTEVECSEEEYSSTCVGIEEMERQFKLFGCQQ